MFRVFVCSIVVVSLVVAVYCDVSFSDNREEMTQELDASKCSEEYENCGVQYRTINITDSTILNATSNSEYDELLQKTVKINGFCCPGLVCKEEGYEEEPVPAGVTHFCADPENEINKERMFEEWKKSLEMPPNYSD